MLVKHFAVLLVGTALITGPVFAQSISPTNPNSTAASAKSGNWITQQQTDEWRASKLKGLRVYNDKDEKIGTIADLVVDRSGKIAAVVIGVGGFLGMGERDVGVPFDEIKLVDQPLITSTTTAPTPDGLPGTSGMGGPINRPDNANRAHPDHAVLNATKDGLKAAPEFKFER